MGKRGSGHTRNTLLTPISSVRLGAGMSVHLATQQNGRLRDVLQTMEEKTIEALVLSEVRCPGHGVSQLEDTIIALLHGRQ